MLSTSGERLLSVSEIKRQNLHFRVIELVNKAFSKTFEGEEYQRLEIIPSMDKERSWKGLELIYLAVRDKHSKEIFCGKDIEFATPQFSEQIKKLAPDYGFGIYRTGTALVDKMSSDNVMLVEIRLIESQSTYSGSLLRINLDCCKRM